MMANIIITIIETPTTIPMYAPGISFELSSLLPLHESTNYMYLHVNMRKQYMYAKYANTRIIMKKSG